MNWSLLFGMWVGMAALFIYLALTDRIKQPHKYKATCKYKVNGCEAMISSPDSSASIVLIESMREHEERCPYQD